jgi:hypothetical protein
MDASILAVAHFLPAASALIQSPMVTAGGLECMADPLCRSGLCARVALCSLQR